MNMSQSSNHTSEEATTLRKSLRIIWKVTLISIISLIAIFLFVGAAGAGFFISLVEDQEAYSKEEFREKIYNYEEVSHIYFANNEYLGEIPADLERKERPLEEISDHLIHAIIATEDNQFFEHQGIVPKALLRAVYQEITNAEKQTGGSTLTQQIIKNQILSNEVTYDRKAKEIALALRMEHFFDKNELLEAYLNIVPFGRNADGRNIAGAESAAEGIFGVSASELNLPQAAFIAGLPQNPYVYTPFGRGGVVKEDFQAGLNRMKTVLNNMLRYGYITEEEYEEALDYDIRAHLTEPSGSVVEDYPFLTYEAQRRATRIIRNMLMEEDGVQLDDVEAEERERIVQEYDKEARHQLTIGGYNVHLTVDRKIYEAMQEAVKTSNWFGPEKDGEPEQTGAILINNKTGAIISFVGGRDFDIQNLNHATQAFRQNGSTMKPLLAYGTGMDQGILQPGTVLPDVPGTYSSGQTYANYGHSYEGFVSVREALKRSKNAPAVRAFQRVDHASSRETLQKLGFTRLHPDEPFESGAIGGLMYGTTVEQNTNAFTVFANEGKYKESYLIEKIETKDGEIVYEHEINQEQVFSPQTAFLMTDILRDVVKPGGTAGSLPSRLAFGGDWAGKTGTTDDYHDSWFVGYNPNVTFGVWIGYDTPKSIETFYKGLRYGTRTQQIWADFMNKAYEANPTIFGIEDTFEPPEGIVRQTICGISGKLPSSLCAEAGLTTTDYFNANFLPTEVDNSLQHSAYVTIHGARYKAYDNTPSEFTKAGVAVNADFLGIDGLSDYLPDHLQNVTPDREAPDNGRTPSPVTGIQLSGSTLSWNVHPDNDIVGYRVYRSSGSVVTSVAGNTSTSVSVAPGGSYYVTAVDSRGRESASSSTVQFTPPPPEEEPDDTDNEDAPENDEDREEDHSEPTDDQEEDNTSSDENDNDDSEEN
ncbi:penicillin-binding protein [Aliibacillus thermotolerans]|nr:penicillin-binding protein [Aliibacillus thermotolerans]